MALLSRARVFLKEVTHVAERIISGVAHAIMPPALLFFLFQNAISQITTWASPYVFVPILGLGTLLGVYYDILHSRHPENVKIVEWMVRGCSFLRSSVVSFSVMLIFCKGNIPLMLCSAGIALVNGYYQCTHVDRFQKSISSDINTHISELVAEQGTNHSFLLFFKLQFARGQKYGLEKTPEWLKKVLDRIKTSIVRNFKHNASVLMINMLYLWTYNQTLDPTLGNLFIPLLIGTSTSLADSILIFCQGNSIRHFVNKLLIGIDGAVCSMYFFGIIPLIIMDSKYYIPSTTEIIATAIPSVIIGFYHQNEITYENLPSPKDFFRKWLPKCFPCLKGFYQEMPTELDHAVNFPAPSASLGQVSAGAGILSGSTNVVLTILDDSQPEHATVVEEPHPENPVERRETVTTNPRPPSISTLSFLSSRADRLPDRHDDRPLIPSLAIPSLATATPNS